MIYFYLPDFYYHYDINVSLIEILNSNPEYFKYDMKIGALYGCFPNQIWNGGRRVVGEGATIENIIDTIRIINETYNIPVRFTYTNCLITESHLKDLQCNFITEVANNGMNEILVNSPILEKYLRNKFPNFKYISSATKCIRDIDKLNELIDSNQYNLVLGDYRDNFDFDFLNKINQKDKLEILINPYCKPDCEIRELHYKILSQGQLKLPVDKIIHCPCETMDWEEVVKSGHVIKTEDLQKYIDMGFKHFKLEGRNVEKINVVNSYIYYFIKPEYQDKVRNKLLMNFMFSDGYVE